MLKPYRLGIFVAFISTLSSPSLTREVTAYTYDAHGRLTKVERGGSTTDYSYDKASNRIRLTTVAGANRAPVANPDDIAVNANADFPFNPLANDTDADGDNFFLTDVAGWDTSKGTVTFVANCPWTAATCVTYRAKSIASGRDSFSYTILDGDGGTAIGTVNVTINGGGSAPNTNQSPVAANDTISIISGQLKFLQVLANDSDPDGDALVVTGATDGVHGGTTALNDSVIYTPFDSNFIGSDSFTYTISDGRGGSATATAFVNVVPKKNKEPVIRVDSYVTGFNMPRLLPVLDNDSDPDGDVLSLYLVTKPNYGAAVIQNGQVLYTPPTNFVGLDAFTYTVSDGRGGSGNARVDVDVKPAGNRAPTAVADSFNATTGQSQTFDLLTNDTDPDNDILTLTSATTPAHGAVAIVHGKIVYTSVAGYVGSDTFNYTSSDSRGGASSASVSITVQASNGLPNATNDSVVTPFNTPVVVDVLANDADPDGDPIVLASASAPANGRTEIADGKVTYTPYPWHSGPDSFTYTIADGRGGTASATVSITVQPKPNQPPVLGDDNPTVAFNAATAVNVLSNDYDPDGDPLTLTSVSTPAHGAAVIANGKITYTPTSGYSGSDSFTYTVSDGRGATTTANVAVTVDLPPNHNPVGVRDVFFAPSGAATLLPVLDNDYDPDGDAVTLHTVYQPEFGTATIQNGMILYSASRFMEDAGQDSFAYVITDTRGSLSTGIVTIWAVPNRWPTANDDGPITVTTGNSVTVPVLANDTDPDGDALQISATSNPSHGLVTIVNGAVTYTPTPGYVGADSFTYTITDNKYNSLARAKVTMNVVAN